MTAQNATPDATPDASAAQGAGTSRSGSRFGLPRIVVILVGLAAALAVLYGTQQLQNLVGPMFMALNLVLAVSPLQSFLVRHKVPKIVAAVITLLVVLAILVILIGALIWAIAVLVQTLPQYSGDFQNLYNQAVNWLASVGITIEQLENQVKTIDPNSIVSVLTGVLSNLQGVLSLAALIVITIFFLMMDSLSFADRLKRAGKYHPGLVNALRSFGEGVRRYWGVTTVFGLIVAVFDVVALAIMGVPLALVWGILSFITNYIPNIGFVIGLIPPALIALVAMGPTQALVVVVLYSVINFVIQSVIQPKFTGESVGVTPFVTFLSLGVWAWALGPLGALLALPATLLVKAVLIDADPKARWVNALIASNPKTADAPVHQETTRETLSQLTDDVRHATSRHRDEEHSKQGHGKPDPGKQDPGSTATAPTGDEARPGPAEESDPGSEQR
uniref:AI-2E family transporter n=1 Tax=Granulicoccus phenolivorans TaxID=266854 RepID=UPI000411E9F6|nr:AI-2E family transporter [Granulicoccus phenolivorans]